MKCISTDGKLFVCKGEEFINHIQKENKIWKLLNQMSIQKDEETMKKIKLGINNIYKNNKQISP